MPAEQLEYDWLGHDQIDIIDTARLRQCRDDDDRRGPRKLSPQRARELVAIRIRQPQIEQHHIRANLACRRDRGRVVRHDGHVVSIPAQHIGRKISEVSVVLYEEDMERGHTQ